MMELYFPFACPGFLRGRWLMTSCSFTAELDSVKRHRRPNVPRGRGLHRWSRGQTHLSAGWHGHVTVYSAALTVQCEAATCWTLTTTASARPHHQYSFIGLKVIHAELSTDIKPAAWALMLKWYSETEASRTRVLRAEFIKSIISDDSVIYGQKQHDTSPRDLQRQIVKPGSSIQVNVLFISNFYSWRDYSCNSCWRDYDWNRFV